MTSNLLAAAAAIGLIGSGIAGASETRSFQALTVETAAVGTGMDAGASGEKCIVDVLRTGAAGSAVINREERTDGCHCIITTGPSNSNGSAELTVTALLRDRECEGYPPAGAIAHGPGSGGAAVGILLGLGGVTAAIVAASKG